MRRPSANYLVGISIAIMCSGCTTYASDPKINERVEHKTLEVVSSFTYEVDAPWKNSRFAKRAYDATQHIIPKAQDNSSRLIASPLPAVEIKISESSSGGACAQEYLTGLSLGLIPSWCTRPNLFKFDFILNNHHGFCRRKTYSISSVTFSHLTVIPFALLSADNQPLTIYQAALKDFLQQDQCTTP